MHRPRHIVLLAAALVLVGAVGAGSSRSAPAGWSRISGPTQPGVQLGLARTADGVLHVVWNRGITAATIFETRLAPTGRTVGTSTVVRGWNGNGGLATVVMPDRTLRLFAAGTGGINTFTAPEAGRSWAPQAGTSWGGPVAESAGVIGATLTKDGQPVTAWRGTAAEGIPPASIPQNGYEGGMTESYLVTDGASGAVVLAGATNSGQGGVYVQQIIPTAGARVVLPPLAKDWSDGVSGRIGAPGVYVAYTDGKSARLYRYGGATKTLARGPFWSATVCPGPNGRLWVAWGDSTDFFVTRSNRAAGAFEPVQSLKAPPSPNGANFAQCEGSGGPLDLFVDDGGFWHTHILAKFALSAQSAKAKVTLTARDAGDPLPGAAITVGGHHLRTDARGRATLALRPGSYSGSATAGGYLPASTRFTVR